MAYDCKLSVTFFIFKNRNGFIVSLVSTDETDVDQNFRSYHMSCNLFLKPKKVKKWKKDECVLWLIAYFLWYLFFRTEMIHWYIPQMVQNPQKGFIDSLVQKTKQMFVRIFGHSRCYTNCLKTNVVLYLDFQWKVRTKKAKQLL